MGSSCEGDALILCRLLGFAVNSFDRPPQLGAVGPAVYALNEFSPLSSFVIRLVRVDVLVIFWTGSSDEIGLFKIGVL